MVLHVLAIGKVRDSNLRAACEDYLARARRYFRIEVREVTPRAAGATRSQKVRAEAAALLGAVPPASAVAVLTRSGRNADSPRFAERIQGWQRDARDVAFVIGGAFGVDDTVLQRATAQISLSPLTLPHELARLVLYEQIYRAGTILKGEPYHKGRG